MGRNYNAFSLQDGLITKSYRIDARARVLTHPRSQESNFEKKNYISRISRRDFTVYVGVCAPWSTHAVWSGSMD